MNELWIAIKELRNEKASVYSMSDDCDCLFDTDNGFMYTSPFAYEGDVIKIKNDQGEETLVIKSVRTEEQYGVFFYVYEYDRDKQENRV